MSYDSEVLADAPVTYVRLNDAPGTLTATDAGSDEPGAGGTLTYTTGVQLGQPGMLGGLGTAAIADVNGTDGIAAYDIVSGPYNSSVVGLSVECWGDLPNWASGSGAAMLEFDPFFLASIEGTLLGLSPGLFVVFVAGPLVLTAPYVPGVHQAAATIDPGGNGILYLDGAAVDSGAGASTAVVGPLYIGGSFSGGWSLPTGPTERMQAVSLYAGVLGPGRIAAHFNAGGGVLLSAAGATAVAVSAELEDPLHAAGATAVSVIATVTARTPGDERTVGGLVITMAVPSIINGRPRLPAYRASLPSTATAIQGPAHIRAIADPNPVFNPYTDGWSVPPPPTRSPWQARWSVDDLPDPGAYEAGFYWLGDPSSADGTATIAPGARQWNPDRSTAHAPPWQSHFPFKPSVTAANHFLQGGGIVHHPKGVNFNSHFIEHMWCDFGHPLGQPYSWVIAALIASYPSTEYVHTILDAGINPALRGINLSAEDCNSPRTINDATPNRSLLQVSSSEVVMAAHTGGPLLRTRTAPKLAPALFVAIFDGASSALGVLRPGGPTALRRGRVSTDAGRRFLLGRQNGWLAQSRASHLVVFEMRAWSLALSQQEVDNQYAQLSATHQFDAYRGL